MLLIFFIFFEIIYFEKSEKSISLKISILLIIIFLASSMKAIYYLYLVLIPIVFFAKKFIKKYLLKKNFLIILTLSLSLILNLVTNYFNTGCFLYPAEKTCLIDQKWSIPKKEVKVMATHYEWWSKAGGGPGYKSEIKKEYIKSFVWVKNWIDRHFLTKFQILYLALYL